MCPIINFAKGGFSETQSRVSNSLLELIQTLYFVQQCESRQPLTEWLPYQDFHLVLILYNTIGSLLDHF
mgnify:CR=1 FL=1